MTITSLRGAEPPVLDDQIRAAEAATYRYYGVTATEERALISTTVGSTGVRLTRIAARTPSSQPPIILLHGIGSVTILAASLLPYLADRDVVAVDTPGHGLSDQLILPKGVDLRAFAVSLVEGVRAHLGHDQVDVIGHSLGGQFGLYAALDLPHRVRRLVLLGAPGAALAGAKPAAGMKLMALPGVGKLVLAIKMSDAKFVEINEQYAVGPGAFATTPPDLITAGRLIAGRPGNAASIASYFRTLLRRGAIRPEVVLSAAELGRLEQPVLFAWGDDDLFLMPDVAARSIVAVRDAHLVRARGTGHAPWLQQPELYGAAVAAHLR
ncbi:alpha/beta fold hydrolase [Nocardioides sp. WS12]|uniref:alpha/beta fold hydrolase n=1 Tax=Nocardioides sp. WS12 TaxID=2486272 RepID=UPI0015F9216D|nr:alpha/beta fold hydrolase [Nocardioides sp. WS12]